MYKNIRKNKEAGFTLIELLVVIAIIGILAAIVLASLSGARERAQVTRVVSDFKQIELAMNMWMTAEGNAVWPHPGDDLGLSGDAADISTLVDQTSLGEYLTSIPEPPLFNSVYTYFTHGDTSFQCGDSKSNGVILRIPSIAPEYLESLKEINRIIENDTDGSGDQDLDCGKLRVNTSGGNYYLYYELSDTQSF